MTTNEKQSFNTKEAAEYLGCSVDSLREAARHKEIPCYKVGRYFYFRRASLDRWIAEQETPEAEEDCFTVLLHRKRTACHRRTGAV